MDLLIFIATGHRPVLITGPVIRLLKSTLRHLHTSNYLMADKQQLQHDAAACQDGRRNKEGRKAGTKRGRTKVGKDAINVIIISSRCF